MIASIYNTLGLVMCIWYTIGYRWTMQGNELGKWVIDRNEKGKIIHQGFMLNWWFAPINMITAFLSAYFVLRALFFIDKSFTQNMMYIATFLFFRNAYYAIEDITDYIKADHSVKQLSFIAIDLIMAAFVAIWILQYKEIISLVSRSVL